MALCTIDDVISIYGQAGVNLTSADEYTPGSPDADHVADAIERAEQEVLGYLNRQYEPSQIEGNTWVKWVCAYLAVGELAIRRGNSLHASISSKIENLRAQLIQVLNGKIIPPGLTPHRELMPAMSNLTIDSRYRAAKIRVQQVVSSGRSDSTKKRFREVYAGSLTWWGIY